MPRRATTYVVEIERRSRVRFALKLPVRFRTVGRGCHIEGLGQVVNMSSGGVMVISREEIAAGLRIEISVEWPVRLDGQIPLQLVVVGTVVRCEKSGFAVGLSRYQFRTARQSMGTADIPIVKKAASA